MKLICLLIVGLTLAGGLRAGDVRPFPFFEALQSPAACSNEAGGFVLNDAVYATTDNPDTGLRIFDQDNNETPLWIRQKTATQIVVQDRPFPAEIVSLKEGSDNRIEILVKRDTNSPPPSFVRLHTPLRNFEKQVTVKGSLDGNLWETLASNTPIYDYSRYLDVHNDRVPVNPRGYQYYKIDIANITETKNSPLTEIMKHTQEGQELTKTETTVLRKEVMRIDRISFVALKETLVTGAADIRQSAVTNWCVAEDAKRKQTIITFATARQPLAAIELNIADANFSRSIMAFGADSDSTTAWVEKSVATISRIRAGKVQEQHLIISFPTECRTRHYRLVIANQDNSALTITGIRLRENLYEGLFFPKVGRLYRVFMGGRDLRVPSYDVATVLQAVPAGANDVWSLDAKTTNPAFKTGFSASWVSGKKLFIIAVLVMVAVLAWVIARSVGKIDRLEREC